MARVFARSSVQYLTASYAPVTAAPLTMACWYWTEDLTINAVAVVTGQGGVDADGFRITNVGTSAGDPPRALAKLNTTGSYMDGTWSPALAAQTWRHEGAIFRAAPGTLAGVADGVISSAGASTKVPVVFDTTTIGIRLDNNSSTAVDGRIAELAFWDVELTADEFAALNKGYSPACIRPANLALYLPLIDDADTDLVSGTVFTAVNSPTVGAHPPIIYRRRGRIFVPSAYVPPTPVNISLGFMPVVS